MDTKILTLVTQVAGALAGAYREDPDLHPQAQREDVVLGDIGSISQTITIQHLVPVESSLAGLYLEEVAIRLLDMLRRQGLMRSVPALSQIMLGDAFVETAVGMNISGILLTIRFRYYHMAAPRLVITVKGV